ncbi:acyltransferase [bacterium]|nr:acyltransferase [bacterium]
MVTTKHHHFDFLDAASVIALVRVVFLHGLNNYQILTTGAPITFHAMSLKQQITDLLLRFSVPVFVMISGFKFSLSMQHHPELTHCNYLRKRSWRLIRPYLIWTAIIYSAVPLLLKSIPLNHPAYVGFPFISPLTIWNILNGSAHPAYQLWFVPMLFLMIICYPPVYKKTPWWISQPILWLLFVTIRYNGLQIPLTYPAYLAFFDLGARLGSSRNFDRLLKKTFLWTGISCLACFIICSFLRLGYAGVNNHFLKITGQEIFASLSIFLLCGTIFSRRTPKCLIKLAQFVWPVFIIHEPLILGQIAIMTYVRLGILSPLAYPVVSLATLISAVIVYLLIKKAGLHRVLF